MLRHDRARGCIYRSVTVFAVALALVFTACGALTWPDASGDVVYSSGGLTVDASHAGSGYVCVKYSTSSKKLKARVSNGDANYTYNVSGDGEYEVLPLQMGSGSYSVKVYEQVRGNEYAVIASVSFKVSLLNDTAPYTCPSQYIWYEPDSPAVLKASEICGGLDGASEKADVVFEYITTHMVYDFMLAITVPAGYLPDVDKTYSTNMGICFDFAALMACMLRSQDVPVRLVIGDANGNYHAWNEVLIDGQWVRYDTTNKITSSRFDSYVNERVY